MNRAFFVEALKLRRSPVVAVATGLMVVMIPLLGVAFLWVAKTDGTGAVAQKAQALVVGEGWEGYFSIVHQVAAVAMLLGIGIVVAWVFGREFVDRTFPSLFALPVSRSAIARAKIAVLLVWMVLLAVTLSVLTVMVGWAANVGPFEIDMAVDGAVRLFGIVFLTAILTLTIAPVASAGRGYLPAIGAIILIVFVAQMSVLLGSGAWFPFAVPGFLAVAGSEGVPDVELVQILLVPVVAVCGALLTLHWWSRAEVG